MQSHLTKPPATRLGTRAPSSVVNSASEENTENQVELAKAGAGVSSSSFADVDSSHFAADSIEVLADEGVVSGYEDGMFRPGGVVNQAECLKILFGAFDRKVGATPGEWYQPYMDAAESLGVTVAGADPAHEMTRGEVAHVVAAFARVCISGSEGSPFSDVTPAHQYFYEIIGGYNVGIFRGDEGASTFRPNAPVSRAELAVIAIRARDAQPTMGYANQTSDYIVGEVFGSRGFGAKGYVEHWLSLKDTIPSGGPYPTYTQSISYGALIGGEFVNGVTITDEEVILWSSRAFVGGLYIMAEAGVSMGIRALPEEGVSSETFLGAEGNVLGFDVGLGLTWEQDPVGPESVSVTVGVGEDPVAVNTSLGDEDPNVSLNVGTNVGLSTQIIWTSYDARYRHTA